MTSFKPLPLPEHCLSLCRSVKDTRVVQQPLHTEPRGLCQRLLRVQTWLTPREHADDKGMLAQFLSFAPQAWGLLVKWRQLKVPALFIVVITATALVQIMIHLLFKRLTPRKPWGWGGACKMVSHDAHRTVETQLQMEEVLLHAAVGAKISFFIEMGLSHPWGEHDSEDPCGPRYCTYCCCETIPAKWPWQFS